MTATLGLAIQGVVAMRVGCPIHRAEEPVAVGALAVRSSGLPRSQGGGAVVRRRLPLLRGRGQVLGYPAEDSPHAVSRQPAAEEADRRVDRVGRAWGLGVRVLRPNHSPPLIRGGCVLVRQRFVSGDGELRRLRFPLKGGRVPSESVTVPGVRDLVPRIGQPVPLSTRLITLIGPSPPRRATAKRTRAGPLPICARILTHRHLPS
jgi:hypothetical protein